MTMKSEESDDEESDHGESSSEDESEEEGGRTHMSERYLESNVILAEDSNDDWEVEEESE